MTATNDRPESIGEIRDAVEEFRRRQSARPDLVETERWDLLWIDEDEDGLSRIGDNVRPDPDTEGATYLVEDPETGDVYSCDIGEAWTASLADQDPDSVVGISDNHDNSED